tara:strand:+ start:848 stop:1969 length:1122 start_codon:yes stop_codon:yes gene_type:complete
MSSPYASGPGVKVIRGTDIPATSQDGLRGGIRTAGRTMVSDGPAFGSNGEINASSKRELMQSIGHVVHQSRQSVMTRQASAEVQQQRLASLREAYADKSGTKFQVLGEVISEEIWETLGREGFSRRLLSVMPLAKGQTGRVKVRRKDVVAYQVTTDVKITEQRIRQPYVYPPEFYLGAQILIEDKEIEQASTDLLDAKFQDGLEAILRREDLITRALMTRAATTFNDLVLFTTFNPSVLTTLRTQVNRWGTPAATMVIAFDIWDDIIADADFVAWWDQVHKHELILEGRLGSMLGMEIITDGYRYDTLQVLEPGEVFVTASPVTVGSIVQRKELDSRAIDQYNLGRPARGWFMEQIQGQVIVNGRAVDRGIRV